MHCLIMATRIHNKKLSKSSRAWMKEHLDDHFVKQAHKDGYRSRAAYKLLEADEKYGLLKPGMRIVDLGSAPGSWSQLASLKLKSSATLIASDILEMDALPDVQFIQGDFRELEVFEQLMQASSDKPIDMVLSDMAPNTSGHEPTDQARMMGLCELAIDFSLKTLKDDGCLYMKVFHGQGVDDLRGIAQQAFTKIRSFKPAASRARSKETYWLCEGVKDRRVLS